MQRAMNYNVAIVYVKGSAYRIQFWYMSKDDAISMMNNFNLKKYFFKKTDVILIEWKIIIKMGKKKKKRLRELERDKHRNLSEEDKNKKREYGRNRYHKMSEEKKQRLKEYQKNYREAKKSESND